MTQPAAPEPEPTITPPSEPIPAPASDPTPQPAATPRRTAQPTPTAGATARPVPTFGPTAGPPGRSRRRRSVRLVLLLVLLAGVLGVGAVGLSLYDEATAPDRSTPAAAVDQFLQAALVDRDVDRVALFVCRQWPAAAALAAASPPSDPGVLVTWGDPVAVVTARGAEVTVRVQFSVAGAGVSQAQVQTWRFDLQERDGWRVCSLGRDGSANP